MKITLDEVVEISPKIVLINKFPDFIDEEMLINFLINNVLLVEFDSFEKIKGINKNILACLINLDGYLFNIDYLDQGILRKANEVIINIKSLIDFYVLAFTVHKFRKIKDMFLKQGIKYYIRVENDKDEMINIIKEAINPIYLKKHIRTSLRIGFIPQKYPILIKYRERIIKGFIKDLCLKWIGIEIEDTYDFKSLHIGSFISINIDFGVLHLNVLRGIIVRKDNYNRLIGIKMNIDDGYELDNQNKLILENIIKTRITKVVRSNCLNIDNHELFTSIEWLIEYKIL
jgi:hypothetical protein